MSISVIIAGTSVTVIEKSLRIEDEADARSICMFQVRDDNAVLHFKYDQPITVTDSVLGLQFAGFVQDSIEQRLHPSNTILHSVSCMDKHYLADKRVSPNSNEYASALAGDIAIDMLQTVLAQEGVTASYASDRDTTQAQWSAGTLSNTVASTNLSDGDLELAAAGTTVTIAETTGSTLAGGTLSGVSVINGSLQPSPTTAIKITSRQNLTGGGNTYTYVKFWTGSYTLASGTNTYFEYDLWIDPSVPSNEAKIALDFVCSDGTTWRDNAVNVDAQDQQPSPGVDLSGLATGQWYHRSTNISEFGGKTIAYITFAIEGNTPGLYTGWAKNIQLANASHTPIYSIGQNTAQQMQKYGYTKTRVTQVATYALLPWNAETQGVYPTAINQYVTPYRVSPAYSISAAGIVKSSYISWNETISTTSTSGGTTSTTPNGTMVIVKYSLDGASFTPCMNNAPLPNLSPGTSVSGNTLYVRYEFYTDPSANPLASPEVFPSLQGCQVTIQPSYATTKVDINADYSTQSLFNTGSYTNTIATSADTPSRLMLNQTLRTFQDGNVSGMVGFGGSGESFFVNNKLLWTHAGAGSEMRVRLDYAGQIQNGIIEFDLVINAAVSYPGCVYRTTGWSNADANYAYAVEIGNTFIALQKGSNSSSTSTGTKTQIGPSYGLSLSSGNVHRLKVIFNGSHHQIYLDDLLAIDVYDSTYTAAGYIGLRNNNGTGALYVEQFDNIGIVNTTTGLYGNWTSGVLSLAPASTYGSSFVSWRDVSTDLTSCTNTVQTSIDGGTTWSNVTNGASIPGLTVGQSLAGVNAKIRVNLLTTTASSMPAIDSVNMRVVQQYSATGTRVSEALSLNNVGRAGSSSLAWNATTPTNTSAVFATSTDGTTFSTVANGGSIPTISSQPSPWFDSFSTNLSTSYTSTGVSTGTWTYDGTNSRIVGSTGSNSVYRYDGVSVADMYAEIDLDQADNSALCVRMQGSNTMYTLNVYDGSAAIANYYAVYSIVGGAASVLTFAALPQTFTRGTYHKFRLSIVGTTLSASMDGVQFYNVTTSTITGAGKGGLLCNTLLRVYNLRVQGYGQTLAGQNAYSKVTLSTTDPTVTPQVASMTLSVRAPGIQSGALVPNTQYYLKQISYNMDDLAKQSDYWWKIDKNSNLLFQARNTSPAPFILTSNMILVKNLKVNNSANSYRNTQWVQGGVDNTQIITETLVTNGQVQSWNLRYPVYSLVFVVRGGNAQTTGIQGTDTNKDFYYTVGSNTLTQDTSDIPPAATESLVISYYAEIPVNVLYSDAAEIAARAAIDGTSGIVESVDTLARSTKSAALSYAQSLVNRNKNAGPSIDFDILGTSSLPQLTPGQLLTVFISEHGIIDQQYLILKITTTWTTNRDGTLQAWFTINASQGPNLGPWIGQLLST